METSRHALYCNLSEHLGTQLHELHGQTKVTVCLKQHKTLVKYRREGKGV